MRYLVLCIDVPDNLKEFDHFDVSYHDGSYIFNFYYSCGHIRRVIPSSCHGVCGSEAYVFLNIFDLFGEFSNEKKKTQSANKPKKFSRRCRHKTFELGGSADERRN